MLTIVEIMRSFDVFRVKVFSFREPEIFGDFAESLAIVKKVSNSRFLFNTNLDRKFMRF